MLVWQKTVSEEYINFISPLKREASKCFARAVLKCYQSLQVHISKSSKTKVRAAVSKSNLSVRLNQGIFDCI